MVDLTLLQTVSYIAGALGVCVAAICYVMNLRISQKNQELMLKSQESSVKTQEQNLETRQAQLYMQLYLYSQSKDYFDAFNKVLKMEMKTVEDYYKILSDPDDYRAFYIVGGFYEGTGALVRDNLISLRQFCLLNSFGPLWWWNKFGEGVLKVREELGFPRYCVEVEYLAKRVAEYGREHPELQISLSEKIA